MDGEQEYGVPDDENPEWTDEEIRTAKLFAEVFPDLALKLARTADAVDPVDGIDTGRPRA